MKTKFILIIVVLLLFLGIVSCLCGTSTYFIINSDQNKASFFVGMGKEYLVQEDWESAIKYCNIGLKHDAEYPDAYYCLGVAYKETDEFEKAKENLYKAKQYIENAVDEDLNVKINDELKEIEDNKESKK